MTHMGEWWGTPQNLLLAFIDELWKTQKNQTFEKWKDMLYISLSYHIILHMRTENDIHMRYSSWDMKWDIIFSHFRPFFVLLPDYWPRKLKFGKRCRKHVEILSFYTCVLLIKAIGMYDVWFLRYEVQQMERFCHCGKLFALLSLPPPPPSSPQTTHKIKIWEKMKKTPWDIIILHNCTKNHDHMLYCSWDIVHDVCFSLLLPLLP